MSLKVWLPLTDNFENKGSCDLPATSLNNSSFSNAGKIGTKALTGTIGWHLNDEILGNEWTVATWCKPNTLSSYNNIMFCKNEKDSADCQIYFSIISTTTLNLGVNGPSTSIQASNTFTLGQWYHVVATYNGTTAALYINGVQVKTGTVTTANPTGKLNIQINGRSTNTAGTGTTGGNVIDYNDFRLYDHALSPAEVKEISRGLVLHYKLDGVNQNLFRYDGLNSYNQEYDMPVYQNKGSFKQFNGCLAINPADYVGKKFTISFDAISPNGTTSLNLYNSNGNPRYFYYSVTLTPPLLGNEWQHFSYTFTNTDRGSSYSVLDHPVEIYMPQQMGCKVRNLKIEFGDFETKWVPFDGTTAITKIIDSSGYGRHGTITGTPTTSNSTPRNLTSTYIADGLTSYIVSPSLSLPGDAITMNFWFKSSNKSATGGYHMPFESGTAGVYEISITSAGQFRGGLYVSGIRKVDNGTSSKLTNGSWHMCTMTFDGTIIKRYVDAVMEKSTSASGTLDTSEAFYIGRYGTGSTYGLKEAYMSDVRLYATALSEDDVLALYKTEAKIPSHSDIHAYAFDEEGSRELIEGTVWTNGYSVHTITPTTHLSSGECELTGNISISTPYISISPSGHTYVYDIEVSTDASNAFYIGFERYDKDKTARSNNACVYITGLSGTASERTHQRYHGIIDLSTDGVNPCAFITLRILNDWSSPNNRKATVHYISLREVSTAQTPTIGNNGVFTVDELRENKKAAFFKNGFVESTEFIEM